MSAWGVAGWAKPEDALTRDQWWHWYTPYNKKLCDPVTGYSGPRNTTNVHPMGLCPKCMALFAEAVMAIGLPREVRP